MNSSFGDYGISGLCNFTWNISTQGSYYYSVTNGDTGGLTIESEDEMASLSIGLFLMALVVAAYVAPFFVRFATKESSNSLIKKAMWIGATALLALVTTIMTTIAENAGLGITQHMLTFVWFFHKSLYIMMIFLFFNLIISFPKMVKEEKMRKRMGED